jgi:hypothetical protein
MIDDFDAQLKRYLRQHDYALITREVLHRFETTERQLPYLQADLAVNRRAREELARRATQMAVQHDAALWIHRQGVDSSRGELIGDGECRECGQPWPCPTARALGATSTTEE